MRILHVLDHSLPLHSGYAFRSHRILRAQRETGLSPFALTSEKHCLPAGLQPESTEVIDQVVYHRMPASGSGMLKIYNELCSIRRLASRCRQLARSENATLIHAHSPLLNYLAALRGARSLGIPLVYEIRAFWEDAGVDHGTYKEDSLKYRLVRAMETWACRNADRVVVICAGLRNDLERRGIESGKIAVVPNGIDVEEFRPCSPDLGFRNSWGLDGKEVVGFIGSFYSYEGLDLLVEAVALLSQRRPALRLILAGGGSAETFVRERIRQRDLQSRVIMPGRIQHGQVPGVYALCNILAYPRYAMRLTNLVTPLKPLEAMAMSKPVVASDVGGHCELVNDGHNGLLFKAGSVKELARAIEGLLADPASAERIGRQARQWVSRERTWKRATEIYPEVYGKALESIARRARAKTP